MNVLRVFVLSAVLVLMAVALASGQSGSGELKLGWVFLDEEGNRSVSHSSFNHYDGPALSLEGFRYRFKNGIQLRSNLRNFTLENRNLALDVTKPGSFGVEFRNNRYRRIYDFDASSETKRDLTSLDAWVYPVPYVRIFAGGSFNNVSGRVADLFNPGSELFSRDVDYDGSRYKVGARFRYEGRMFHAEYNKLSYSGDVDKSKDQTRNRIRLFGYVPVPRLEWVVLTGAFEHFETEFDRDGFKMTSNTGKGGILANLPHNIALNYVALFNRAGSDSDLVNTDNVAHLFYASYNHPGLFGFTVGYQRDINDDFEDVITANAYYFSGRFTPNDRSKLRLEYGRRAEEVDEGSRLIGTEDRNRIKFYGSYAFPEFGFVGAGVESRERENDELESEAEFIRYYFQLGLTGIEYFVLTGGFSYSDGDYVNSVNSFCFDSRQFHFGLTTKEYRNFTGGLNMTYFRNEKDLDAEGIDMSLSGSYRFANVYRGEFIYRVLNFDDFLAMDQYYTENIFEINLIRSFSL